MTREERLQKANDKLKKEFLQVFQSAKSFDNLWDYFNAKQKESKNCQPYPFPSNKVMDAYGLNFYDREPTLFACVEEYFKNRDKK